MTIDEKIEIRFWLVEQVYKKLEAEKRPAAAGMSDNACDDMVKQAMERYANLPVEEIWRLLVSLMGVHLKPQFDVLNKLNNPPQ